jgi:hypothetical protein
MRLFSLLYYLCQVDLLILSASMLRTHSGLSDNLVFKAVEDLAGLEKELESTEALVAFNVTAKELPVYAALAQRLAAASKPLKRLVLAVNMSQSEGESESIVSTDSVQRLFREDYSLAPQLQYTVLKYSQVQPMAEAKLPYRIVDGNQQLPAYDADPTKFRESGTYTVTEIETGLTRYKAPLATGDLYRVLAELVDLPEAMNRVVGIGAGNSLDYELQVMMKSSGYEEWQQIAILLSGFAERQEEKLRKAMKEQQEKQLLGASPVALPATSSK